MEVPLLLQLSIALCTGMVAAPFLPAVRKMIPRPVEVARCRVAFIMQTIMSTAHAGLPPRRRKFRDLCSFADAWTVGFTPHFVTAVWGGNADWRMKMTKDSDSDSIAAPMWHSFMQQALDAMGIGDGWYSQPPGLVVQTCKCATPCS